MLAHLLALGFRFLSHAAAFSRSAFSITASKETLHV